MIFSPAPAPSTYSPSAFNQFTSALKKALLPVVSKDEAVTRILLRAPDGTTYEVTVDNSGNLVTAVNDGKSRNF